MAQAKCWIDGVEKGVRGLDSPRKIQNQRAWGKAALDTFGIPTPNAADGRSIWKIEEFNASERLIWMLLSLGDGHYASFEIDRTVHFMDRRV